MVWKKEKERVEREIISMHVLVMLTRTVPLPTACWSLPPTFSSTGLRCSKPSLAFPCRTSRKSLRSERIRSGMGMSSGALCVSRRQG